MGEVLLQILWVAAHHGLRNQWRSIVGVRNWRDIERANLNDGAWRSQVRAHTAQWSLVHDITATLGNPPAPGGPR